MFASNPGAVGPPFLTGVHGFSSKDVWAVGAGGIVSHYDGTTWTTTCLGIGDNCSGLLTNGEPLLSVWGSSSADLFAVGAYGTIIHFDGQQWVKMTSGTTLTLYDVWGSSGSNVYSVGMNSSTAAWVVLHYDGTSWQKVDADPALLNRSTGVWGGGQGDVYVVGDFTTHFDGSSWQRLPVPINYSMIGVGGSSSKDVFIVGSFGAVMHWNGSTWKAYDGLLDPSSSLGLETVWTDGQSVFIVGHTQPLGIIITGLRQ